MDLLAELAHVNINDFARGPGGADDGRDGERIYVTRKFYLATHLRRGGHRLPDGRNAFAECESCGGIEATAQQAASTQHRLRQQNIDGGQEFIPWVVQASSRKTFTDLKH